MATHMNHRELPTTGDFAAITVTPQEDEAFTHAYRVCRNAACNNQQPTGDFCCPACWRRLPGYLRDEIWRTERERSARSGEAHQAREDATAWLEDRAPLPVRWRT